MPEHIGLRQDDMKLVKQGGWRTEGKFELNNLKADVAQTKNLSAERESRLRAGEVEA